MATETKKYIEAVGRRKTSIARVRLTPGTKQTILINDKRDLESYFPIAELRELVMTALSKAGGQKFTISAHLIGGGVHSQAKAFEHGISRALIKWDPLLRKLIKQSGLLTRDSRTKERRKFGLKKARKAPQWSKR